MEVSAMEETKKTENHLTSAAAFVEGGIQEACDDACSICLEAFCDSDPSTVTTCKHEFHLQCILEWCQRSSQCPMCWQSISLKDPTSQELLEAVERERNLRFSPSQNATIFHYPALGDFELQHLPVGSNDADLEERIIQHLAAAAAMGRAHHIARREGQRSRASAQGRPQFLVFSSHSNEPTTGPVSASPSQRGADNEQAPAIVATSPSVPLAAVGEEPSGQTPQPSSAQTERSPSPASGSSVSVVNRHGLSFNNRSSGSQSSPVNDDRAGPSDFQSFSESLKSRFNAVSMRYKESISKSTRGWKERLFSRNNSIADIGSEVRREVNAGIASVSRMMERLESRENSRADDSSVSNNSEGLVADSSNQSIAESHGNHLSSDSSSSASAAAAGSN
ncbi:E3 ubiquitin-protein ligase RHF2A-like isoform X2 [Macadamia integrifolia]|uniref:E3 ubiquitin-protein ligase RHF2A-like isoform X2 n=1 Tax=Macadamia integrifolia TaxID=60698 RepID=UPI001C4FC48C|nr:E3 ubiquitin-protein ligase RHF2A-like isoform X2 [Macadamia integrifolia]